MIFLEAKTVILFLTSGNMTELSPIQERQLSFRNVRDQQSQFLQHTTFSVAKGVLELDYPVEIDDPLSTSFASRALSLTLRHEIV